MKALTAQQRLHVAWCVRAGILSPDNAADAIGWGARIETALIPSYREPVRPRRSEELNATLLHVQILKRELELLQKERNSPEIERQRLIKRARILTVETAYEALKSNRSQVTATPPPESAPTLNSNASDAAEAIRWKPIFESLEIAAAIGSIANLLESQKAHTSHSPIRRFGTLDASLCMLWSGVKTEESADFWEATRALDVYKRNLVYSARTAELAAQSYYRALGCSVEDVSVQQLEGSAKDWISFDIRAGDRCIDVKNARHSLNGHGHFVEHCVPRFKKDRTSAQDVVILGILSEYVRTPSDYFGKPQLVCVLGEVTIEDLRGTYRWSRTRFGRILDLRGLWKPQYVAGWLFEYPSDHYSSREAGVLAVDPLLHRILEAGGKGGEVPGWMLVLCRDDQLFDGFEMESAHQTMISDLRSIQLTIGLSRRSLYVYALGLTSEHLARQTNPAEDLAGLLNVLKIVAPWGSGSTLLGLHDPQSYVEHLVKTLTQIGQAVLEKGLELTGFRLTHPAILIGITSQGDTVTLLAYCGGWQSIPFKARCGRAPLTLPRHEHCPGCGHLICDNCGHCSNICPECEPRQSTMGRASSDSDVEAAQEREPRDPEYWDA